MDWHFFSRGRHSLALLDYFWRRILVIQPSASVHYAGRPNQLRLTLSTGVSACLRPLAGFVKTLIASSRFPSLDCSGTGSLVRFYWSPLVYFSGATQDQNDGQWRPSWLHRAGRNPKWKMRVSTLKYKENWAIITKEQGERLMHTFHVLQQTHHMYIGKDYDNISSHDLRGSWLEKELFVLNFFI